MPPLMHAKLKDTPGIYVVGFMGSGKSTVGQLLADHLKWPFVDLDTEIERRCGQSITEIFEHDGEAVFRDQEHQALLEQVRLVREGKPRVVALGGGAFVAARNREPISTAGISIWLDCPVDTLWQRISAYEHRPLARDRVSFEALYGKRRQAYQLADFRVDASGSAPQIVAAIEALGLM